MKRRGVDILVMAGMAGLLICGASCSKRSPASWYGNLDEGLVAARVLHKDALIFFSSTNWPGMPGSISRDVLTNAALGESLADSCVLINLDIPKGLAASTTAPAASVARIQKLLRTYRVTALPVLFLADCNGLPYARLAYHAGKPDEFVARYQEARKRMDRIQETYLRAQRAHGVERARVLDEAVGMLTMDVILFHRPYVSEIVRLDADGRAGLRTKYMTRVILFEAGDELERKNPEGALQVLDRIEREFGPKGEVRQSMFVIRSQAYAAKQDPIGYLDALQRACEAAPQTETARQAQKMIQSHIKPAEAAATGVINSPAMMLKPGRLPGSGATAPLVP